ncbi:MAG: hypothetical protein VXW20_07930 [Pseudomonadota bacterium]|nr:hypothetical protein [Pseudomonadota bacterium]
MRGEVMPESFFASVADAPLPDIVPYDEAGARARLDDIVAAFQTLFVLSIFFIFD